MILTITLNPALDKVLTYPEIRWGASHRNGETAVSAGGKGVNVARIASQMGYPARALVVAGGHTGDWLKDLIEAEKFESEFVQISSESRAALRVRDRSAGRVETLHELGPSLTDAEHEKILEVYRKNLSGDEIVCLCGSVPSESSDPLYSELISIAKEAGCRTILDTSGTALLKGLKTGPFALKPNVAELEQVAGHPLPELNVTIRAASSLILNGLSMVFVSMGRDGLLAVDSTDAFRFTPPQIEEKNPGGCGDAVVAGMAIGLLEGWPLEKTGRLATALGASNASLEGVGSVDPEQVKILIDQVEVLKVPRADSQ